MSKRTQNVLWAGGIITAAYFLHISGDSAPASFAVIAGLVGAIANKIKYGFYGEIR